jgi:hypothetical protein
MNSSYGRVPADQFEYSSKSRIPTTNLSSDRVDRGSEVHGDGESVRAENTAVLSEKATVALDQSEQEGGPEGLGFRCTLAVQY